MVVLLKKIAHFPQKSSKQHKLDHSESIALQSFNTSFSETLHKLLSDQKNGLNYASFSITCYIPCLKFIQGMNRAFAKLVKDLDYPVSKWKGKLAEDYFSYTLNILDALNMISGSISYVGIKRLNLSHAVSLITSSPSSTSNKYLKPIIPKKVEGLNFKEIMELGSFGCGKERLVHEAMMKMRSVDMLVLKVLVCGLCGEFSGKGCEFNWGEFGEFSSLGFGEEFGIIKEIKEINEMVKKVEACLVGEKKSEAEDLKNKLSELESLTEMVGKEVDCLFSEVLARRNELINCFRLPKCT